MKKLNPKMDIYRYKEEYEEMKTENTRRVDDLGRIAIPKEIRQKMNVKEGDTLEICFDGDKLYLEKYIASYKILNIGCDDETEGVFEFSKEQFEFLNKVFTELNKNSTYGCMPKIYIEEVKTEQALKGDTVEQRADELIAQLQKELKTAKSEAIKEFAERLKKKSYPFPCASGVENAVTIKAIYDLVEEMEGK